MRSINTLTKVEKILSWLHDKTKDLQLWFLQTIVSIFMTEVRLRERALNVLIDKVNDMQNELDELSESIDYYKRRIDSLK